MMTFLGCMAEGWVIEASYRFACYGALIAAGIALLLVPLDARRRAFRWVPLYAILVVVHPGWPLWPIYRSGILAVSSDCGYSDRFFSVAIVVVLAGTLALRVFRPDFRLRLYMVVLAGASWWIYFAIWLYWHRYLIPWTPPPNALLASIFSSEAVIVFTTADRSRLLRYSLALTLACILLYRPWQRHRYEAV